MVVKCLCIKFLSLLSYFIFSLSPLGPIPAVLGGLHRLRRLDVSNNQLSGAIPSRLTQLSLLQELLLHGNQLSGVLPEAMGQWGNLTSLQVQNNCLQGE